MQIPKTYEKYTKATQVTLNINGAHYMQTQTFLTKYDDSKY